MQRKRSTTVQVLPLISAALPACLSSRSPLLRFFPPPSAGSRPRAAAPRRSCYASQRLQPDPLHHRHSTRCWAPAAIDSEREYSRRPHQRTCRRVGQPHSHRCRPLPAECATGGEPERGHRSGGSWGSRARCAGELFGAAEGPLHRPSAGGRRRARRTQHHRRVFSRRWQQLWRPLRRRWRLHHQRPRGNRRVRRVSQRGGKRICASSRLARCSTAFSPRR